MVFHSALCGHALQNVCTGGISQMLEVSPFFIFTAEARFPSAEDPAQSK